jgi:sugar lactone lactonase YvrE
METPRPKFARTARGAQFTLRVVCLAVALLGVLGSAAAGPTLYVANENQIRRFDIATGASLGNFATTGLNGAFGLAFDVSGNLFVANGGFTGVNAYSIQKYSPTGAHLGTFASGFSFPIDLAFDAAGNLYVACANDNTVRRFAPDGTNLGVFASSGLNQPLGIAFDTSGNLYVANASGNTIRKFSPHGVDLGNFATTGLNVPIDLVFDTAGNLYVDNASVFIGTGYNNIVRRFSPTAADLGTFAVTGNASTGMIFDNEGHLYVASQPGTIREYDPNGASLGTLVDLGYAVPLRGMAFAPAIPEPGTTLFGIALLGCCATRAVRPAKCSTVTVKTA